ncbi:hypothetical protein SRHO_G00089010 [Serrasalmus rhombeus]
MVAEGRQNGVARFCRNFFNWPRHGQIKRTRDKPWQKEDSAYKNICRHSTMETGGRYLAVASSGSFQGQASANEATASKGARLWERNWNATTA